MKVIIEEVISQTFDVGVEDPTRAYETVRRKYRDGELVVENPSLTEVNAMICDENGEETDWVNLHWPSFGRNRISPLRLKQMVVKLIESQGEVDGDWLDIAETINYLFALDFTEEEILALGICTEEDIDRANARLI